MNGHYLITKEELAARVAFRKEMISRRSFFGLMGAAVVATPALAELLTPKRTIFLPPKGGWVKPFEFNKITTTGFHKDAFYMDRDGLWLFGETSTELLTYDHLAGSQWPPRYVRIGDRLTIEGVTRA